MVFDSQRREQKTVGRAAVVADHSGFMVFCVQEVQRKLENSSKRRKNSRSIKRRVDVGRIRLEYSQKLI